jgi:methionyl-tRNA synthetase
MTNPCFVTTPIYYVNGEPHVGHAYTTVLADVIARYARLRGQETRLLTGTDEHGQKVWEAARAHHTSPQELAAGLADRFRRAWLNLDIQYDDFIRTTEPRHAAVVHDFLERLKRQGDIYLGQYEGWYCVPDERFWTDKDLSDGACPDCDRAVERVEETNYFFRLSAYQDWLIEYIRAHPDFIRPALRRNEVLGFLRKPLGDLCVSRPRTRVPWGIPLPFDDRFVTYVWFDALINYVTGAGYRDRPERFAHLWPAACHLIGKDILITHGVYWPIILRAIGLPLPRAILAHGWWVLDGEKISKSRGNSVTADDLAEVRGTDALRYFLIRRGSWHRDSVLNHDGIVELYDKELANGFGNLAHRILALTVRHGGARIPLPGPNQPVDLALQQACEAAVAAAHDNDDPAAVGTVLDGVVSLIADANRYVAETAPWVLAKAGELRRLHTVLYHGLEALRLIGCLLEPVVPRAARVLADRLGVNGERSGPASLEWGRLQPGTAIATGEPLFPRVVTGG